MSTVEGGQLILSSGDETEEVIYKPVNNIIKVGSDLSTNVCLNGLKHLAFIISIDNFGRVTINNFMKRVKINGKRISKNVIRPLINDSKIEILDYKLCWKYNPRFTKSYSQSPCKVPCNTEITARNRMTMSCFTTNPVNDENVLSASEEANNVETIEIEPTPVKDKASEKTMTKRRTSLLPVKENRTSELRRASIVRSKSVSEDAKSFQYITPKKPIPSATMIKSVNAIMRTELGNDSVIGRSRIGKRNTMDSSAFPNVISKMNMFNVVTEEMKKLGPVKYLSAKFGDSPKRTPRKMLLKPPRQSFQSELVELRLLKIKMPEETPIVDKVHSEALLINPVEDSAAILLQSDTEQVTTTEKERSPTPHLTNIELLEDSIECLAVSDDENVKTEPNDVVKKESTDISEYDSDSSIESIISVDDSESNTDYTTSVETGTDDTGSFLELDASRPITVSSSSSTAVDNVKNSQASEDSGNPTRSTDDLNDSVFLNENGMSPKVLSECNSSGVDSCEKSSSEHDVPVDGNGSLVSSILTPMRRQSLIRARRNSRLCSLEECCSSTFGSPIKKKFTNETSSTPRSILSTPKTLKTPKRNVRFLDTIVHEEEDEVAQTSKNTTETNLLDVTFTKDCDDLINISAVPNATLSENVSEISVEWKCNNSVNVSANANVVEFIEDSLKTIADQSVEWKCNDASNSSAIKNSVQPNKDPKAVEWKSNNSQNVSAVRDTVQSKDEVIETISKKSDEWNCHDVLNKEKTDDELLLIISSDQDNELKVPNGEIILENESDSSNELNNEPKIEKSTNERTIEEFNVLNDGNPIDVQENVEVSNISQPIDEALTTAPGTLDVSIEKTNNIHDVREFCNTPLNVLNDSNPTNVEENVEVSHILQPIVQTIAPDTVEVSSEKANCIDEVTVLFNSPLNVLSDDVEENVEVSNTLSDDVQENVEVSNIPLLIDQTNLENVTTAPSTLEVSIEKATEIHEVTELSELSNTQGDINKTNLVKEEFLNADISNNGTDVSGVIELISNPQPLDQFNLTELTNTSDTYNRDIDLTGVQELVNTTKPLDNFVDMNQLAITQEGSANDIDVRVNEQVNTPKPLDKTNLVGIRELMSTPYASTNEIDMRGVKELVNTPTPLDKTNFVGMKQLMSTPYASKEIDMRGVKELVNTPKPLDKTNLVGIRELMTSPYSSTKEEIDMRGVKELVNTPKPLDKTNLVGMKELLNTPDSSNTEIYMMGVKELLNTPKPLDSTNLVGMKELLNTPNPLERTNLVGMKELLHTPDGSDSKVDMVGVKELLNTPKLHDQTNYVGMSDLLNTPSDSKVCNTPQLEDANEVQNLPKTPMNKTPLKTFRVDYRSRNSLVQRLQDVINKHKSSLESVQENEQQDRANTFADPATTTSNESGKVKEDPISSKSSEASSTEAVAQIEIPKPHEEEQEQTDLGQIKKESSVRRGRRNQSKFVTKSKAKPNKSKSKTDTEAVVSSENSEKSSAKMVDKTKAKTRKEMQEANLTNTDEQTPKNISVDSKTSKSFKSDTGKSKKALKSSVKDETEGAKQTSSHELDPIINEQEKLVDVEAESNVPKRRGRRNQANVAAKSKAKSNKDDSKKPAEELTSSHNNEKNGSKTSQTKTHEEADELNNLEGESNVPRRRLLRNQTNVTADSKTPNLSKDESEKKKPRTVTNKNDTPMTDDKVISSRKRRHEEHIKQEEIDDPQSKSAKRTNRTAKNNGRKEESKTDIEDSSKAEPSNSDSAFKAPKRNLRAEKAVANSESSNLKIQPGNVEEAHSEESKSSSKATRTRAKNRRRGSEVELPITPATSAMKDNGNLSNRKGNSTIEKSEQPAENKPQPKTRGRRNKLTSESNEVEVQNIANGASSRRKKPIAKNTESVKIQEKTNARRLRGRKVSQTEPEPSTPKSAVDQSAPSKRLKLSASKEVDSLTVPTVTLKKRLRSSAIEEEKSPTLSKRPKRGAK